MSHRRWNRLGAGVLGCLLVGTVASAQSQSEPLVIFDFEDSMQDWAIPDWAKEKEEDVGRVLSLSQEIASSGVGSLQLLADFPGEIWTGAYIEVFMHVTDWTPFSTMSIDVYLPPDAPTGLDARWILTVGDQWTWTEMNRSIPLTPGEWTTISVGLKPGSMDWKFFPDDNFRASVKKIGVRIESNKDPVYQGSVFVDNIRLAE